MARSLSSLAHCFRSYASMLGLLALGAQPSFAQISEDVGGSWSLVYDWEMVVTANSLRTGSSRFA